MSGNTSDVDYVYQKFEKRVMSERDLRRHNYPMPDPLDHTKREARDKNGQALTLQRSFGSGYECHRCGGKYEVDDEGKSLDKYGVCRYHHRGRYPVNIGFGVIGYGCCKRPAHSRGCCTNQYHVHTDQPLLQNYSGYVETKPKPDWGPKQHGVYALDCEMCFTVYGQELVRVAVVDHNCEVVYSKLVKPTSFVLDYYPLYTGLTERDLRDVRTTLADVQRDLLESFSSETILVGHDLENDFKALKLVHKRVVDTTPDYVYQKFEKRVMSEKDLRRHNYPMPDPLDHTKREARDKNGRALTLQRSFASSYECLRCGEKYQVDDEGKSLAEYGDCIFHHRGRQAVKIGFGVFGYPCCKKVEGTEGCCRNRYHVHKDQPLLQNYSDYVETKPKMAWPPSQHEVYALACEMCFTVYGQELVRVAVVDHNCEVVYSKLVKPTSIVLDHFPLHTGLTESDMKDVRTTLADVQRDLLELFSSETILVGHDLENDFKALKLFHKRVVDTVSLYPYPRGLPCKSRLRKIAKYQLDIEMTEVGSGKGHDCTWGAIVAMRRAKWVVRVFRTK